MKSEKFNFMFHRPLIISFKTIALATLLLAAMFGFNISATGQVDRDKVHLMVDKMPLFNGKEAGEFTTWAAKEIRYPAEAVKQKITGSVYVSFIVEKDGTVSTVKVLKSVPTLDDEAVRVVKSSPKWTPGEANNIPVRVMFTLPVKFMMTFPSDAKLKVKQ
jgi:TonB family protein